MIMFWSKIFLEELSYVMTFRSVVTLFNKYQIAPGERPDTIAEYLYGDPGLDWVVMMTANIINV